MKVLKFGGTSVGSVQRMHHLLSIIPQNEEVVVVLSAMSGTTNSLESIASLLHAKKVEKAKNEIEGLKEKYAVVVEDFSSFFPNTNAFKKVIENSFQVIEAFISSNFSETDEKILLAQGEQISTGLFYELMKGSNRKVKSLPALQFMKTNEQGEPDMEFISKKLNPLVGNNAGVVHITQGYICLNSLGDVDNLKRGGSDYTASIIGAAIHAEVVEIWTDISGFHNNDPRVVEGTTSLKELAFEEAAELAYFGAKILHPSSVLPARKKNIPVLLKNTLEPEHPGTKIHGNAQSKGVRAIAAKDGITVINIRSGRMLLAYGFLRKVFEIFEKYKTPIDMITTSEVAVSVTIDDDSYLKEITNDLEDFGEISVLSNTCIVAIVGDLNAQEKGLAAKVFYALKEIPLHMISYGGSKYNVSVLIDEKQKKKALNDLSNHLLNVEA